MYGEDGKKQQFSVSAVLAFCQRRRGIFRVPLVFSVYSEQAGKVPSATILLPAV